MAKFHVVISYDLDSNESHEDAWKKFKEKYKQDLWGDEERYPESTAVLEIIAENDEEAIQKAKAKINRWSAEIEKEGIAIYVSKFFIACCYNEDFL